MAWHLYPVNDEREHVTDREAGECWCAPEVQYLDPETNLPFEDGPLIVHHAADCREVVEEAERILGGLDGLTP